MTTDPNRGSVGGEEGASPDPLKVLTDNQKDALRLAHEGLSAGEIAVRLNLRTKSAANDRIWEARQKLGGVSKRDAGRMLAEAEQRAEAAKSVEARPDPYSLLPGPEPLWVASNVIPDEQAGAAIIGGDLQENRTSFESFPVGKSAHRRRRLASVDATAGERLLTVLQVAVLTLVIIGLLKSTTDGFDWFYKRVSPAFQREKAGHGY